MRRQKPVFAYCIILLLIVSLPLACLKHLTKTDVLYENDFQTQSWAPLDVAGFTSTGSYEAVSDLRLSYFHGQRVLGKLNSNVVSLTFTNLPSHQLVRVELDLYLHDKWKNDLWKITVDGTDHLLTGFSNDSSVRQAYPNWLGNGSPTSPPGRDAIDNNLPGACSLASSPRGSSMYRIVRTVLHSDSKIRITCSDAGNFFNDTCQRSWSIDNMRVSIFKN